MSLSEVKNRKNVQNCETEKLMEKRRKQSVRGTETESIYKSRLEGEEIDVGREEEMEEQKGSERDECGRRKVRA